MLNFKNTSLFCFTLLLGVIVLDIFFKVPLFLYGLLFGFWFIMTLVGSFSISRNFHVNAFSASTHAVDKKVAITFDDGPNATYTPKVLKLLKEFDATATFFCIGKHIEEQPELFTSIVNHGHSVGNHSYSHSKFFDFFGTKKVRDEIERTYQIMASLAPTKSKLFRPPYGVTNPAIAGALKDTNQSVIGWNVRSFDTVIKNPERIKKRLTKRIKPGAIILLHDSHDRIVSVLEHLLIFLQDNGYQSVSVNELMNSKE